MRMPQTWRSFVAGATLFALATGSAVPAFADAGPWPTYLGNNRRTGLASSPGPRLLTLAWYSNTGDDVESSPAIANDGSVYVASNNGTVQARHSDGGEKWTFTAGARVYASPILGQDGEVLIGDTRGRFRALNADTGKILWTVSNLGSVRATAAMNPSGIVFLGTEAGDLVAIDSRDAGKEKFRVKARAGIIAAPAIATNGDVLWSAQDDELRRMNASGNIIWQVALDGEMGSAPSIGDDGTVYVGSGGSILALSPDSGAVKWRVGVGGIVGTTPVIGPDGSVYAGSDNGKFVAVGPDGKSRWEYQTGAPIHGSAAISSDGIVYVGSGDGTVYAFATSGQRLSTFRALDAVYGTIAIGSNGVVYAGSRDNRLYAIRDNVRTATASPGDRIAGDVVRDPADGRVFVIVDDQRRYIPDATTQILLGLTTPNPRNLNAAEIARYPEGPALPALAEGSLIRASNGPIYVIQGGKRVWQRTMDDLAAAGLDPQNAQAVDDRVLRSLTLSLQEGLLLKGTDDRVHLYTNGALRWLSTASALASRGDWSQVHFVSNAALNALPQGEPIT